jgi:leucyl aminopeptidase
MIKVDFKKEDFFNIASDVYVIPVFLDDNDYFLEKFGKYGKELKRHINVISDSKFKNLKYTAIKIGDKSKEIIFLGLGEKNKLDAEKIRLAAGFVSKELKQKRKRITTIYWIENKDFAKAQMEGFLLADYEYNKFKTDAQNYERNLIIFDDKKIIDSSTLKEIITVVNGVNFAKDLANSPSNIVTPSFIANEAKNIVRKNKKVKIKIFNLKDAKKMGMNAFYSVAKGSDEPAKFIVCEYMAGGKEKPIVLIGKGITFDSGGISLKPQATALSKIEDMKYDMSGAACMLSLLKIISELNIKMNLVVIIPATENMPSGKSYKPGDIIKTFLGKTVEVISTDAEGRLILADAIAYSLKYGPELIIDAATLTGACVVALGKYAIGLMGNNEKYIEMIKKSGYNTGEKLWELPLWDEYKEQIKSKVADLKNVGGGDAATITAGIFLKEFTVGFPWLHLDIAGTAYDVKNKDYIGEGASGAGVRLIFDFIKNLKEAEND